ncbi:MAG TPA: hypothetical protein VES67_03830 [Vicinamibacterales bacterium]|nr:hypothetical protein [Vicinamibacterales bacterium]
MSETAGRARRYRVGSIALALAALAGAWTLLLLATGGFDITLFNVIITAHDVTRPAWAGAIALAVYVWARGPRRVAGRIAEIGRAIDRRLARVPIPDRIGAWVMAAAVTVFGVGWNAGVGGGADTYGYLSQAELWRHGVPIVPQPFAAEVPWPDADWTFTPLGYAVRQGGGAIVPTYAVGLPLVMAAVKSVAGHAAIFWIAPLAGAVLVLVAYDAGRRLASSRAGLMAAFLTATSQALLGDLTVPTSDVLAAAGLSGACVLLFRDSRLAVAASGLAVALALPVRPNLAPSAAVLGLWLVITGRPATRSSWPARLMDGAIFGLAALPGLLIPMWSNAQLYGSPFASGYGDIGAFYQWRHLPLNLYQYPARMFEAQSWLTPIGIAAVLLPIQKLWPDVRARSSRRLVAVFAASLLVQYLFYEPARDVGFLRYLLPVWPFVMVGLAQVLLRFARPGWRGAVLALAIVAYGANAMYDMSGKGALPPLSERKYSGAAELARARSEPNSLLLAMQHSGSARYYSGRMTLRYDILNPAWLDRSVAWLSEHGVHTYALLDDWEAKDFRKRFAGQATAGQLDRPVFIYQGAVATHFYDLVRPAAERGPTEVIVDRYDGPKFPLPAPPLVFGFTR